MTLLALHLHRPLHRSDHFVSFVTRITEPGKAKGEVLLLHSHYHTQVLQARTKNDKRSDVLADLSQR